MTRITLIKMALILLNDDEVNYLIAAEDKRNM